MRGEQPESHYLMKARQAEEQAEQWRHDPTMHAMWLYIARAFRDLAGSWDPGLRDMKPGTSGAMA
jgi:hypothetical protein